MSLKRKCGILLAGAILFLCAFYPASPGLPSPERTMADTLLVRVNGLQQLLSGPFKQAVEKDAPEADLRKLFLQTRLAYKKIEWAAEYFDPAAAALINGAPVPEFSPVAENGPGVFLMTSPEGLQVIETILYPHYDPSRRQELLTCLQNLQRACDRYRVRFTNIDIIAGQLFDAARLEIFRIQTLTIAGFDTPLAQQGLGEAAAALEGLNPLLKCYPQESESIGMVLLLDSAVRCLLQNSDFDRFDRAAFITRYGNELSRRFGRMRRDLGIPLIRYPRLLRQDAETLFDAGAFDSLAYALNTAEGPGDLQILLGKRLFFDTRLSGNGTRSCASCHQPDKAFTDGLVKNTAMGSVDLLQRNTPTLINAALQPAFFDDLRAAGLDDQISTVLADPREMHSSLQTVASRLEQDTTYRRLFASAYPKKTADEIDTLDISMALSAYLRSLIRLNSRFDDYMRGNQQALSTLELTGFNLFMGKARCGTCHYMPLFNGVFPPVYNRIETEVIGVPASLNDKTVDKDPGRGAIIHNPALAHAFKTTTVRNANRTAPYMHNGVFTTLQQVIDFYDQGGGRVDNQTLPADSLHLTASDKAALIAFIKSLDSQ